jgi:hypothetical protein
MSAASRILRILGMVFAGIGLAMLLAAAILAGHETFAADGMLPTVGEVVAFQNNKPVVRFPISASQTVTVVGSVSSRPPAYDIGEKLRVFYDPRRPQHALIDSFLERWFVPVLIGGLGGLFATIGGGFLFIAALRNRRVAWLRRHGTRVTGHIVDVAYNRFVRLNRRPTWQIIAEWTANGRSGRAASSYLMADPRPRLGDRTAIDLWLDPRNPNNALVDIDFLDPRSGGSL